MFDPPCVLGLISFANYGRQYAQELLSTFGTALGEVALQPATGGTFVVTMYTPGQESTTTTTATTLWDRKTDGGFPETKELKRRVRDVIDPKRDLGHVDKDYPKPAKTEEKKTEDTGKTECEDCK